MHYKLGVIFFGVILLGFALVIRTVSAQPIPTSPNYRLEESDIGGGGLIQSDSANYRVQSALGDNVVGNAASANYQVSAGPRTTNDPSLTFVVNGTGANFGAFSPAATATATSSFSVLNYTSYGYMVQIEGAPPKNNNHSLDTMDSAAAPQVGIEQFGLNVVANTAPISFGANPDHGEFGVGAPTPNYNTPNKFRYTSGDTIVTSPKSSGLTTYTISYIVNVDNITPGGQYKSNQTLICMATF